MARVLGKEQQGFDWVLSGVDEIIRIWHDRHGEMRGRRWSTAIQQELPLCRRSTLLLLCISRSKFFRTKVCTFLNIALLLLSINSQLLFRTLLGTVLYHPLLLCCIDILLMFRTLL